MADDEIQKLRRAAERAGPTPFLLGLCDPDDGELLLLVGREGRARLRAMLAYADRLERAEAWRILTVKNLGHDGVNHVWRVRARDLATGQPRELHLCLWDEWRGAEAIKDNEQHALFLKLVASQGADPQRTKSWTGTHVLVAEEKVLAPTFAEHLALADAIHRERCTTREADPTIPPAPAAAFVSRSA
jgi:hypothetical protein